MGGVFITHFFSDLVDHFIRVFQVLPGFFHFLGDTEFVDGATEDPFKFVVQGMSVQARFHSKVFQRKIGAQIRQDGF